ncbi:MAG: hypothetical protein Q4G33_05900 [bacterium]|nr:hypothetical protein [bacterium]
MAEEGAIEGDYPLRFSMAAENNHYYKVTATLTGKDQTKDVRATLFSERRHPILLDETIAAGESKTVSFVATLQNVFIKGRDGAADITYKDDMLNVVALGDNVAVSSIIVEEVEHQPTIWMYDDSTGCDYPAIMPYSPLQNYGGTGAFFTKYLPEGITIANQGDGGINAADNTHWNCAKENIQAGDWVYVQYGHNHKDDGPLGYLKSIPKYYEYAHSKGAYTVYAGPIDRHNEGQYDASTNTWNSTLNGFSKAAKYYTELIITGGKTKADEFVTRATEEGAITDEVYAWADSIIASGITADGAKDVAFIDLNQPWLDWMETVCEDVKTVRGADKYERNATDYYFQGVRGGGIDGTHPNDAGADNSAKIFFDEAKKVVSDTESPISAAEAEVLRPLVTGMRDVEAYKVPADVITQGTAPNNAWPLVYIPSNLPKLPTAVKDIKFNDDGTIAEATVLKRQAELPMSSYGIVVITIFNADGTEKGKLYAVDQVDNTVDSTQIIVNFRGDTVLAEGDTYEAIVLKAVDSANGLIVDEEDPVEYSAVYVPTNIDAYLLPGESADVETFVYYGKDNLNGAGSWVYGGSNGSDLTFGTDGDRTYATVAALGSGNSFFVRRPLENLEGGTGTSGKYLIDADVKFVSGSGMTVELSEGWTSGSPFVRGSVVSLFEISSNGVVKVSGTEAGQLAQMSWTNIRYTLDMDNGVATMSVGGDTPIEVALPQYQTFVPSVASLNNFIITTSVNKGAFNVQLSNMTVAKLKQEALENKTITAAANDDEMGSVYIGEAGTTETTVAQGSALKLTAVPNEGYELSSWIDEDGNILGFTNEINVKAYKTGTIIANFTQKAAEKYEYLYHEEFKQLTTATLSDNGWKSTNAQDNMTIEDDANDLIGNYLRFGANSNSRGAVKAFDETYTSPNGIAFGMSAKFNKGSADPNEIAVHSGNIVYNSGNINYGCTGGYVLHLNQTSNGTISLNGTETTIPDNSWFNLMANCDFTAHKAVVKVTSLDGETEYFNGEVDMADTEATGIAGMYYKFGKSSGGVVSFDNIEIFSADQLKAE